MGRFRVHRSFTALLLLFAFTLRPAHADRDDSEEFDEFLPTSNVIPWDGIPWQVATVPERIVVIGDIHGDLNNLIRLLRETELVTGKRAEWVGGKAHLVLLGDLIDRGVDSKAVMLYVKELIQQAQFSGGDVHVLLGNHEALAAEGDFRATKHEIESLRKGTKMGKAEALHWAYRDINGPFANWIASRNSIVQLGSYVFVHAGLGAWAVENDPGEVNSTVRAWIRYLQGNGAKPRSETSWVVDDDFRSPLWIRAMSSSSSLSRILYPGNLLQRILDKLSATHIFIGHSVTDHKDYRIVRKHPDFGESVIEMDTGNSYAVGGRPSVLVIEGDSMTEVYPSRKRNTYWITKKLRSVCIDDIRGISRIKK